MDMSDTEKMSPLVASVYWLQEDWSVGITHSAQLFDVVKFIKSHCRCRGEVNLNSDITYVLKNAVNTSVHYN